MVILKKEGDKMVTQIKLKRVSLGIKQKDLAKAVGITAQYMMYIETGKAKNPSITIMKKIAKELNSTVTELFFETEAATSNQNTRNSESN